MLCVCRTPGRKADAAAGANGDPNKEKKKKTEADLFLKPNRIVAPTNPESSIF